MKRRWVWLGFSGVVAAGLMVTAAASLAQDKAADGDKVTNGDRGAPGARSWWADRPLARLFGRQRDRFAKLRDDLNLSDEQRVQIRDIVAANRADVAAAFVQVHQRRLSLRDAVLAETVDESVIKAAAADMGSAIGDAAVAVARPLGEIRAIMTDEQKALIKSFRAEASQDTRDVLEALAKP